MITSLIIFIILCSPASAVSTIKVGDQLNLTSRLVSPNNNFTLGFFPIEVTNRTYLGIWYTNDEQSIKVWVANPSTPIISSSSVLMIDPDTGKLIISSGGITVVNISDNQSGPTPNLTETLQDTGNFQLHKETDNQILWQSFDHPINVLLPGMKLGSDTKTGKIWNLTSWLSDENPDFGAFSLSWEPINENSQRLMIRRRGQPYWTSGDLNNQTFRFMMVDNPFSKYRYNLSYVYNNEERYFSYRSFNGVTPMWILTANGQVLDGDSRFLWSPEFCYGYDSGNGCVAGTNLPLCRSKDDDFFLRNGDFAPDLTESSYDDNSSLILSDCMVGCWNDCGCLGFVTSSNGTGCIKWTGPKSVNNFSVNPQGVSVKKDVLVSPNPSKGNASVVIWASVVAGIFLLIFCFGLFWYVKNRKLKQEGIAVDINWSNIEVYIVFTF